ncbi:ornithine decarboxylase [[Candida] railenensis]|uniref:ornithine decarboxylase n=1 Tax=[Candida] railenensis TaxID=45579 RepID=A0A9P0QVU4_9ASCO|nr:ornithine decarboxylase [[Candida] railenensis]
MAPSIVQQEVPIQFDHERLYSSSTNDQLNFRNSTLLKSTPVDARLTVGNALLNQVSSIDCNSCDAGEEDSFFVADIGEVGRAYKLWKDRLPNVQPFYAVKCNTDIEVIKRLAKLGCNFDCASKQEFETVLDLGIEPERIVYANPCKTNSYIRRARECSIQLTTVDNSHELFKLAKFHPSCGILIRIATDDETAQCRLSTKFGCTLDTAMSELLPLAHELGLPVKGVAFHVGSGATDFTSIYKAIGDSRKIFDRVLELGMPPLTILDIGGGFQQESFLESSKTVSQSLEEFFPSEFVREFGIEFMAEPGRFMVSRAFTLATNVIARRDSVGDVPPLLYINDGVYGNMNCILFDHQVPAPHVLSHGKEFLFERAAVENGSGFEFSIWGPTCDGLDCVSNKSLLSRDVQVGDWLYFPHLGAYTSAASTSFNGFKGVANVIYVFS